MPVTEEYHQALAAFRSATRLWLASLEHLAITAERFDPENQQSDDEAEQIVGACIVELRAACLRLPGLKQMLLAALGALRK